MTSRRTATRYAWIATGAIVLLALGPSAADAGPQADRAQAYYRFLLGRHLEAEGEIERAAAELREAARLDPGAAAIRAELAAFFARQDRPSEAARWGEAAIELEPSNHEAHRVLGFVIASEVGLDTPAPLTDAAGLAAAVRAIEHLEAARRTDRIADLSIELTLARLYVRTGVAAKAVPVLQRLLALDSGRPAVVLMLAEAHEASGQLEEAAAGFRRVVQQRPRDSDLHERLGDVLYRLGRYREAVVAWEHALAGDLPRAGREGIEHKIKTALAMETRR